MFSGITYKTGKYYRKGEKEMYKALNAISGVKSVNCLGSKEEGTYDFVIVPEENEDIRAVVYKKIVERGKTLLSLESNELSLEQIFLRLTETDNDEARRQLGAEIEEAVEETEANEAVEIEIEESEVQE